MSTETTNKKIKIDNGTTFGRTYTDKAIDAKLPTDLIASANKLSLGVGSTTLGNGVNLEGFTYDEATKTLKAEGSGATLPAGTLSEPFLINNVKTYGTDFSNFKSVTFETAFGSISLQRYDDSISLESVAPNGHSGAEINISDAEYKIRYILSNGLQEEYATAIPAFNFPSDANTVDYDLIISGSKFKTRKSTSLPAIPTDKTGSYYLEGTYDATSGTSAIKWSALKKTYNHYIVITDGTTANMIFLLIPSTNNLKCDSFTNLNVLLGTNNRFIQASGNFSTDNSRKSIVAINWKGSFAGSKVLTIDSEEAVTKFTTFRDDVIPA